MKKFRKSNFLKMFSLLMAFSILFSSCKDLIVSQQIDNQADEILKNYSGAMSEADCTVFKQSVNAVKGFIWQQRSNGLDPSRADIAKFVYDLHVSNGTIPLPSVSDKEKFANFVKINSWDGDQTSIINKLVEENYFSTNVASVLNEFRTNFQNVTNYSQAYSAINEIKSASSFQTLTKPEKVAVQEALDGAEKSICYEESSVGQTESRGWCEECTWTKHWKSLIVSVLITMAAWFIGIITFGLSYLLTSVVLVTVWATTWVLVCVWVWCNDQPLPLCPKGQSPSCQGTFSYDPNLLGLGCFHAPFAAGDFQFGNCILSPVLSNGSCPFGSTRQGANCLWECFDNNEPKLIDGLWRLPNICK